MSKAIMNKSYLNLLRVGVHVLSCVLSGVCLCVCVYVVWQ